MPITSEMHRRNVEALNRAIAEEAGAVDAICLKIMRKTGDYVVGWLKGKTYTYKDQTYNLTDSTGCAIYKNGVLTEFKYMLDKQATKPRVITYHKTKVTVNGRQLLEEALTNAALVTAHGYSLELFSAAPYGICVNEGLGNQPNGGGIKRGVGWFDNLQEDVEREFKRIVLKYGIN